MDVTEVTSNESSCDSGLWLQADDEAVQEIASDPIITPEMVEEEAKLAKANEALLEKERRKKEKEMNDEILREQSKKRLLALLEKSKFFATYMHSRIEDHNKKVEKNKNSSNSRKRKLNESKYAKEVTETVAMKKLKIAADDSEEPSSPNVVKKFGTRMTPMGFEVSEEQPVLLEGAVMRDYQLAGLKWLKSLFETGMNGILADEMGLGKTIQTISLVCHLYANGILGPILIVAPLSTLPNWLNEFETFAPQIPVVLYHGSGVDRKKMSKSLLRHSKLLDKNVLPVVITSYEVPCMDRHFLGSVTWKYLIVDEGHRIKNHKSQLAMVLGSFKTINRLLLTGTPLQNNLPELWSLLHFLLPEVFDSLDVFETLFTAEELQAEENTDACLEKEEKSRILTLLHEVLTPFLLRRLKSDVDLAIPRKKEILVRCPMTKIQLDLYKGVLDKSIILHKGFDRNEVIPDGPDGTKLKRYSSLRDPSVCYVDKNKDDHFVQFGEGDGAYKLNVKMTVPHVALMKILNHPYLIHPKVLPGSDIMEVDQEIIESSGKMTILDELLKRLKSRGHRVLIFSTFTTMLNIIEEYMVMAGYEYRRLDGNTDIDSRRTYMREFNTNPEIFTFLLSTRAGGLGINLTGADTVIIYNSDWNPQADLQAQDRCHRIGQTKPVLVYRFMVPTTIDERIVSRASSKRKLEKMVIQKGMFKHGSNAKELSLEELRALLNEKQHNLEVQPNGTTLTDEEWETLLDRSNLE